MKSFLSICLCVSLLTSSGCATILTGRADDCQKIKPAAGQPVRQVRVGYLFIDILLLPWGAVDFATNKIYRPCETAPRK